MPAEVMLVVNAVNSGDSRAAEGLLPIIYTDSHKEVGDVLPDVAANRQVCPTSFRHSSRELFYDELRQMATGTLKTI